LRAKEQERRGSEYGEPVDGVQAATDAAALAMHVVA
jgi:hypothetical protein